MVNGMKTVSVNKGLYSNYLKKAAECFEAANDSLLRQNNNATVINAIHCAISASDALLVFFKGIRSAGQSHEDVISLLRSLEFDKDEINNKIRQLQKLLHIKNSAEYEEKLMTESNALSSIKNAERFFKWVEDMLTE